VLWGLVDLTAWSWQHFLPNSHFAGPWAWPVCLVAGVILTVAGRTLQKRHVETHRSIQCRDIEVLWNMMGVALAIYIAGSMVRHLTWQYSYIAALLIIVGLTHAISAMLLRWHAQGVVAAIWWAGAIAALCARSQKDVQVIMLLEMCFGMIAFGLYVMFLENRNRNQPQGERA
jgi:4-hydroxybenzoate polyprenyltransferase